MDNHLILTIDTPKAGLLEFRLLARDGRVIDRTDCPYSGPVDNLILTTVDNLIHRSSVDRFALQVVELGTGIDKSSTLYRVVQSFAAAIRACLTAGKAVR